MTQQPPVPPQGYWDYPQQAPPPAPARNKAAISFGVLILGIVGLVMSMQSTSLLNGTGNIWLGVALVAVALAASFIFGGSTWVKVVAAVMLVLALGSALYMEDQMNQKRAEITKMFDS